MMKRLIPICVLVWLLPGLGRAGPAESAIVAVMRLSEQPNYSWVATISDDARTYDIVGKTVRGGFTRVRMPVINTVRRQLGRGTTDTEVDLIFRGNVACVIETEEGWKRPEELRLLELSDSETSRPSSHVVSSSGGGMSRRTVVRSRKLSAGPGEARGYSNLQLAVSHPHEELGVIVGSHAQLNVEGDVISGTLTDLGAQLLLVRDGQDKISPLRGSGTFKLWLRDGLVARYQVQLEGTLELNLPTGMRTVNVVQTTTTVLKDIGTTRVDVPLDAEAKLGR